MIFVTGGTGMVGAHLLYALTSRGEKVRALRRPGSTLHRTEKIFADYGPQAQSLLQHIEWVDGDILEKDHLRELLNGVDEIYHAAAMVSFDPRDRDIMIHNNCLGTANLADLALSLKIPRFCHFSSISAIGSPPDGVAASEDHPWRNTRDHSAYAESKYLSEMEVWRGILEGLNAVIVNPSVIIGPDNWKSGSSALFSTVWNGLKFYTRGVTGFIDVRDVVAAALRLMEPQVFETAKNQRYILSAENVPFHYLLDQIADALQVKRPKFMAGNAMLNLAWRLAAIKRFLTGIPPSITSETARSANKLHYYDGARICRTIGFEYTPISDTIRFISGLFLKDFAAK